MGLVTTSKVFNFPSLTGGEKEKVEWERGSRRERLGGLMALSLLSIIMVQLREGMNTYARLQKPKFGQGEKRKKKKARGIAFSRSSYFKY